MNALENSLNKVTIKLNNNVRKALAEVTLQAKKHPTFNHFSYDVDWSNFPNSLLVTCHLNNHCVSNPNQELIDFSKLVQLSLLKKGIKFRDFRKNFALTYDSQH